ncbi:ABC transporter permease [Viridibacillus sp. YIM B01967]|uniref:ABC transporter permease n=1 Tax=Viridibacillus soli TaxID=2798301 RepID=A0ABS1H3A9_9BACL|nr:ABC transporter permease [Viridibacillus soli]MBK3493894.1 ABC transporter permease [Viridibacillus soli]
MKNLEDIWAIRFKQYLRELFKYLRFVFATSYIAIIIVLGFAVSYYGKWLQVVTQDFPAEWIVSTICGALLSFSRPTTLIREPDQVYFLQLESRMGAYFRKAILWTYWSQIISVLVIYCAAIPLLLTVENPSLWKISLGFSAIIILKYVNVRIEFSNHWKYQGDHHFINRLLRIVLSIMTLKLAIEGQFLGFIIFIAILQLFEYHLRKKVMLEPIPFEYFSKIERARMTRFYRLVNYFTDVPFLRENISRRAWLGFVTRLIRYDQKNTSLYLMIRTFLRTDESIYLWARLTIVSAFVAAFVTTPFVVWLLVSALSFATIYQLKHMFISTRNIRMNTFYPVPASNHHTALQKLLRGLLVLQACIVLLSSFFQSPSFLCFILIIFVGEMTIRFTKQNKTINN